MQNCINEERVAAIVGWGRTVGAVVSGGLALDLYEPGHIRRTMAKRSDIPSLYVGEPHGQITPRLAALASMLNDVDVTKATDNLWGERWTKLCVNGMRNGVSAATGMGGNERDGHDAVRRVCIALGAELVRVGQALGYQLGKIGALDPETLARAHEGDSALARRDRAPDARGHQHGGAQPIAASIDGAGHGQGASNRDRVHERVHRRKRPGSRRSRPTHARLTEAVKQVERGEIPPRPANVLWN